MLHFAAMPEGDLLQQAIAAARRGERRRAREMLTKVLKADQQNEQAWLWMSAVVESERERIFCLQSALKINPQNKAAESGLMLLGAIPAKERPHSILQDYAPDRAPTSAAPRGQPRLGLFRRRRTYELIGLTLLGAAAFFAIGFGVIAFINTQRQNQAIAALTATAYRSPTPPATVTETPSPRPTATPALRTPTPTLDPATPLALVVGSHVTATVAYFETPHIENDNFQAGLRRYNSGDWPGVIQFMQAALDSTSRLHEAHFYIGEAYRQTGKLKEAIEAYGEAIKLNANYAPAYWGRGLAQASLDRSTSALADFQRAIDVDPNWPDPYMARAAIHRRNGDLDVAKTELETARSFAPSNASVRWRLAEVLADLGQTDEALAETQIAIQFDPTIPDIYRVRGRLRAAKGQYDEARLDLGLYLTYRPDDAEGWYYRAVAGAGLRDEKLALADFERALAISPRYAAALVARGEFYLTLSQYDEALADFNAALSEEETPIARVGRGKVFYNEGDFGKAVADFSRAVARAPQDYAPNYWLGRALVEDGSSKEAIGPFTLALTAAAGDADRLAVYLWRARAYQATGDLANESADLHALLALWDRVPGGDAKWKDAAKARLKELDPDLTATAATQAPTPGATLSAAATVSGASTTGTPTPQETTSATPSVGVTTPGRPAQPTSSTTLAAGTAAKLTPGAACCTPPPRLTPTKVP
ncbi:MAG: tetratricopeptide repeat protein [Chloroflexi bacterium]|nr:tetratricopeptide repeat protein [Chloroflexota bacterium]